MRFSIREMLALTFLVALGMLVWRARDGARRDEVRLAGLHNEIKNLEVQLRLDNPALHQAMLRTHDEFESLHTLRERAVEHFGVLRQKYSTMEPRAADVLSIRNIPSLQTGLAAAPAVYRLLVPEDRPIWLKFGVHIEQESGGSQRNPDDDLDLLTESPFEATGPFEMQLPAGDQTLTIATGAAEEGSLSIVITLNDEVLLRSAFVSADVTGSGSSWTSPRSQSDYGLKRPMPWLLTAEISLRNPAPTNPPAPRHSFTVWLSDRSSSFARFPIKEVPSEEASQ